MNFDWQNIDTVLLDMDGTLLDLHYDNYFWQTMLPKIYAAQYEMELEEAVEFLQPIFESLQGTLNWYSVDFWSAKLGIDVMHHKAQFTEKIAYRPGAQQFLDQCNQQTEDVRLITNGHRKVLDLKMRYTNIDQYFHKMICSHELGAAKEEQDFWLRLQDLQGFEPDQTLFVDDSEAVLEAADKFGVKHLYSIARPDSVIPRRDRSNFPMIEQFVKY